MCLHSLLVPHASFAYTVPIAASNICGGELRDPARSNPLSVALPALYCTITGNIARLTDHHVSQLHVCLNARRAAAYAYHHSKADSIS